MISIDYGNTNVIHVPQSFMTLTSGVYVLETNNMRQALKSLEEGEEGIIFPDTHTHNTEVVISNISYARSISILSPYTVEFEDGQYVVSMVGSNNNILDVKVPNQVSVLANNSAGLINSEAINDQSFIGARIYINTAGDGLSGTNFPRGTPPDPSDNWADASVIADNRKLRQFDLFGTLALGVSDDLDGTHWFGNGIVNSGITLGGGSTEGALFEQLQISGAVDGRIAGVNCLVAAITNFSGALRECVIGGNITLDSNNVLPVIFRNCMSGVAGTSTPIFDSNGANCDIQFRNWTGGLEVRNFNQGNNMSIDVLSGTITIDSSCTSGTIVIRGVCELIDNSGAGCTVVTSGTITELVTCVGGSGVWTEPEKDKIIQDVEDAKRQATNAAMNSQTVKQI